jgi:hypothetical protein
MKALAGRAGDEAWLRSNPVAMLALRLQREGLAGIAAERHAARELVAGGYGLSAHYLETLGVAAEARRHGVVGLVLGKKRGGDPVGWADRLSAKAAGRWSGRAGLPFEPLDLLGVLLGLLRARQGDELFAVLPEARAFEIADELDTEISGPSMTIAGALAVLDAVTGSAREELAAAVSLVQLEEGVRPSGAAGEDLKLVRVEGEVAKLEGFERECGRGSLVLVAPDTAVDKRELHRMFERVWHVGSLRQLGGRLEAAGLLGDFARPEALSVRAIDRVEVILQRFSRSDFLIGRAIDLAARLKEALRTTEPKRDVPARRLRRALSHSAKPLRLDAVLRDAVLAGQAVLARAEAATELADHAELCAAAIELAAAHYVDYHFEAMAGLMRPWRERLAADPRLVPAELRVRVLGNLARALSVWQDEAEPWRALCTEALALQAETAPAQLPLTRGFFIGALLASDALDEAEVEIAKAEGELLRADYVNNPSLWFLRFDRAELARRRGEVWDDPEMERAGLVRPGQFGRAMGYYFQATARQAGRVAEDAAARFDRAAEFFGAGPPLEHSGLWVFVHLMRLGAAERRGDGAAWESAYGALAEFLARDFAAGIRDFYGATFTALPASFQAELGFEAGASTTSPGAALEALLARDPYLLGRAPHLSHRA